MTWPKNNRQRRGATMSKTANTEQQAGERVTIAGADKRSGRVYHTDAECNHAPERGSHVLLNSLTDDYRECRYCAGEYEAARNPDFSYLKAALEYEGDNE